MKKQEFKDSLKDIKCSDDFRSKMNAMLSEPVMQDKTDINNTEEQNENEARVITVTETGNRKKIILSVAACAAVFICTAASLKFINNNDNSQIADNYTVSQTVTDICTENTDFASVTTITEAKESVTSKITEITTSKATQTAKSVTENILDTFVAVKQSETVSEQLVTNIPENQETDFSSYGSCGIMPEPEIGGLLQEYSNGTLIRDDDIDYLNMVYLSSSYSYPEGACKTLCDYLSISCQNSEVSDKECENSRVIYTLYIRGTNGWEISLYVYSDDHVSIDTRYLNSSRRYYMISGITDYIFSVLDIKEDEYGMTLEDAVFRNLNPYENIYGYNCSGEYTISMYENEQLKADYEKIISDVKYTETEEPHNFFDSAEVLELWNYSYNINLNNQEYTAEKNTVINENRQVRCAVFIWEKREQYVKYYTIDEQTFNSLMELNEEVKNIRE